ncbi:hypothetical protein PPYR_06849 [Photinus pyralis]|uniref:Protein THEM6 n=3 Tax=Photinus pyralis TaxID=7054 RepID=A0A5N4ANV0_PHOPY|nr:hypothetical protein PPYR_06843 [Photinus pyralis]KAB0798969.1 hypothetical protein PPYR_06849 [Photinus pyralis]
MLKVELDLDLMMLLCAIVLAAIVLLFVLIDIQYFVRSIFVLVWGRIFEPRKRPDELTTIFGMCTTSDLDIIFAHMNNARYVRELDFARFHFYDRTGIYKAILGKKGNVLQSACIIRYRRTIPLFTMYRITTKMVYWDDKSIYLEQRFISLRDKFIKAVVFSKQGVVGVNAAEIVNKLLNKDDDYRPEKSEELEHFIKCLDASSMRLRKKDD